MGKYMKAYQSPVGLLTISVNEDAVIGLHFGDLSGKNVINQEAVNAELMRETVCQLDEYFSGRLKRFDLPLEPAGTEFQRKVWRNLTKIPYGETRSYREIAILSDCPKGFRAVGLANNRNPIVIIIPCHRVIGANGSLTGFGGGLENKEFLLKLEGRL